MVRVWFEGGGCIARWLILRKHVDIYAFEDWGELHGQVVVFLFGGFWLKSLLLRAK